jgi:hypothetical protein
MLYKTRVVSFSAAFFFSFLPFSTSGHAYTPPFLNHELAPIPASTFGHGYLGVSVGASCAKLGRNRPQISYTSGVKITDAYPLNNNSSWSVVINVNGGYEFTGGNWKPAIALGLGGYYNPQYDFSGKVIETAAGEASSPLYKYRYHMSSARVMAEIQLTWVVPYVSPFIDFGIGPAWNSASGYKEKAVHSTGYPPLHPFHSRTNLNFAWQAGLGVSFTFNWGRRSDFQHERISLGYHYASLGKTSFGTRGSQYPHHLSTGSLTSNDVYFSYTHLF